MIGSQQIEVIQDEWLTKAAQLNCYNVPDQVLNSKSYLGKFTGPTLLTAKIDSNEKSKIQALLNIGFDLCDTNLKFEILGSNISNKQDAKTNGNIQVDLNFINDKFITSQNTKFTILSNKVIEAGT